ncbi:MAG: capsular polysaccharide biosynthesis protein [Ruminococcus sp.]|nr:capsular polysaccharide biosynthesis protein [Ruminococcus sp.]
MLTDYHCHILPDIDDGADNKEVSLEMFEIMKGQGVERIIATPHFYSHCEKSVADFIEKRKSAFDKIKKDMAVKNVLLGAEVSIEHGISELPDIEKLAIEGTNLILLELPYRPYSKWMSEEIYNIAAEYNLVVILAHVHRYLPYYNKDEIEEILSTDAILQINNEAFTSFREKKFAKFVINGCERFVFGSDAHNTTSRRPNWDLLQKKVKSDVIEMSDSMIDKYMR